MSGAAYWFWRWSLQHGIGVPRQQSSLKLLHSVLVIQLAVCPERQNFQQPLFHLQRAQYKIVLMTRQQWLASNHLTAGQVYEDMRISVQAENAKYQPYMLILDSSSHKGQLGLHGKEVPRWCPGKPQATNSGKAA